MGHIFISYSHKDKKYVEKLEEKLIEKGFTVWIDHRIDYGSQWTEEIEHAIDTCDAYIVVMSEDSKKSPWVKRERIHAENKKKPFFPLLLNGVVWFSLSDIHYVDVRKGFVPPEDFYGRLEVIVSKKPPELPDSKPPKKWQEQLKKFVKPVSISLSTLILITAILAAIYISLPDISNVAPFVNSSELTVFSLHYNPNIRYVDISEFSPDENILVFLNFPKYEPIDKYETNWYYLIHMFDKEKYVLFSKKKQNASSLKNFASFELSSPHFVGEYRVDVLKEGKLIGIKYFSVK